MVLEDNARTPSGVSYVLENRLVMTRTFPACSTRTRCRPSTTTRRSCSRSCAASRRRAATGRRSCCSRPGIYNSAYFEHSFLAQQMGIELVEGSDLVVDADVVYMKTIRGLRRST